MRALGQRNDIVASLCVEIWLPGNLKPDSAFRDQKSLVDLMPMWGGPVVTGGIVNSAQHKHMSTFLISTHASLFSPFQEYNYTGI